MHTVHLLPGVAIQPNLELKTRPKPVLGSLPLAFALPDLGSENTKNFNILRYVLGNQVKPVFKKNIYKQSFPS